MRRFTSAFGVPLFLLLSYTAAVRGGATVGDLIDASHILK